MKAKFLIIVLLLLPLIGNGQSNKEYIRYNFTQLFELIEREKDSVFTLNDAIITFDSKVDTLYSASGSLLSLKSERKDTIFINKALIFNSVFFGDGTNGDTRGILSHMVFNKEVKFFNSVIGFIENCTFKERLDIRDDESFLKELEFIQTITNSYGAQFFNNCIFESGLIYFSNHSPEKPLPLFFQIYNSEISTLNKEKSKNHTLFLLSYIMGFTLKDNTFNGVGVINIIPKTSEQLIIEGNKCLDQEFSIQLSKEETTEVKIRNNNLGQVALLSWENYSRNFNIGWNQFSHGLINHDSFFNPFLLDRGPNNQKQNFIPYEARKTDEFRQYYIDSIRVKDENSYKAEISLRGKFHTLYKEQYDNAFANAVYLEIKDLETERLAYLNSIDPNFKTFFTWKVNQFLKVFSAYGTEPARAIIFSLYVILVFALVYLFFPNSWDAHGKNRIVDRYRFFFKYLKRNAGIHEVYLEEKQQDLMGYEEFKTIITNSEKSVPRFFSVTALPLYHWAISGTRLSAKILSKVDILKGTWEDLPAGQKAWKSFLLVGGFLIALVYDLLIKVLNALMLSINTFTTLGFGEIPIKGLPRYLAIIQGFIGWFMLTIFSVSLISQLLN